MNAKQNTLLAATYCIQLHGYCSTMNDRGEYALEFPGTVWAEADPFSFLHDCIFSRESHGLALLHFVPCILFTYFSSYSPTDSGFLLPSWAVPKLQPAISTSLSPGGL